MKGDRIEREIKQALSKIKPVTRDHYVRATRNECPSRIDRGKGVAGIVKAATRSDPTSSTHTRGRATS